MRTEGSIHYKLKQVCYRHRKKRIENSVRPLPTNCIFNGEPHYPEEVPESKRPPLIRICFYDGDEEWGGLVCDEKFEGTLLAKRCPCFKAKRTAAEVKAEFEIYLETAEIGDIAAEYPDIAALMWVLSLAPSEIADELQETEDEQEFSAGDLSPTE